MRDIGLALTYPKYFRNDASAYRVIPFKSVLNDTTTSIDLKDKEWMLTTDYKGEKRSATILLLNDYNPTKPTLIYHHGAGSTHPIRDFNLILGDEFKQKFNVFIVWAQYHHSKKEYLEKSVDSFLHHQQTFVGSVLAYEEITKFHKSRSDKKVIATGSSMGGIVSSLHALYFGTADYYFPIVAYPNVGEIFLSDAYKYAVKDIEQKRANKTYSISFDIKHYDNSLTKKVFPILGTKDKVVKSDIAIKFWEDRGFTVTKFPYGHFTPGIKRLEIRKLITDKLNN